MVGLPSRKEKKSVKKVNVVISVGHTLVGLRENMDVKKLKLLKSQEATSFL